MISINNKKSVDIFLFLILFAFAVPFVGIVNLASVDNFDVTKILGFNPQELSSNAPKTSGYYNLTGTNIIIDDSDQNYNWSKTAAENPWCSGSGTLGDPYIIENVYIDGNGAILETSGKQHSANCLSIYRSTAYFIVRGCFFARAGSDEFNSGIYLAYTENGVIYNNTLAYNGNSVFVNDFSHNTTVRYNVMYNNRSLYGPSRGASIQFSEDILFEKNYLSNTDKAIYILHCDRVEVKQNFLTSTSYGYTVSEGGDLRFVNYSKFIYNVLAGDYSSTTFEVFQYRSAGNIIQNNIVSGTIPNLGTPNPPELSSYNNELISLSDGEELITLSDCYFNTVSNNIAYVPGYSDPAILSYNPILLLGVIGVVMILLITREVKRKHKNN